MPLGFNTYDKSGISNNTFLINSIHAEYKGVTQNLLLEIAEEEIRVSRNEDGEIYRIFLYGDANNPMNQRKDSKVLWDKYFEKLKKLSKLNVANPLR